jgi:hypothetical protein
VLGLGELVLELELVLGLGELVPVPVPVLGLALQEVTEIGDAKGDRDAAGEGELERDVTGD